MTVDKAKQIVLAAYPRATIRRTPRPRRLGEKVTFGIYAIQKEKSSLPTCLGWEQSTKDLAWTSAAETVLALQRK